MMRRVITLWCVCRRAVAWGAPAMLAAVLLVGCDRRGPEATKIKPADIPAIAANVRDDATTLSRIEEIIALGSDAVGPLTALADRGESERYTAIVALARIGTAPNAKAADIAAIKTTLAGRLQDPHVTLRTYAAGGLAALGDSRGLPVLIDALAVQERALFSEPPVLLNDFAYRTLQAYTGQAFGYDPLAPAAERAAAQQRWRAWYAANSSRLQWDAGKRVFEVRP